MIAATAQSIVIAFVVSLIFTQPGFSAGSIDAGVSSAKTRICQDCCATPGCCSMSKNETPGTPPPVTNSRTVSAQELLDVARAFSVASLFEFPPVKTQARFSSEDFPHYSSSPLAKSCIQLI